MAGPFDSLYISSDTPGLGVDPSTVPKDPFADVWRARQIQMAGSTGFTKNAQSAFQKAMAARLKIQQAAYAKSLFDNIQIHPADPQFAAAIQAPGKSLSDLTIS